MHQTTVFSSHLVPENPRTRFRVAFGAIAAEHAAVANEGAVDTPPATASPQFRPRLWLIGLHGRRGIVRRQILLAQRNRLHGRDAGLRPRPGDLVEVQLAARP